MGQANLPKSKKWLNATYLAALKSMVSAGDLVQIKNSYKLSLEFQKKEGGFPQTTQKGDCSKKEKIESCIGTKEKEEDCYQSKNSTKEICAQKEENCPQKKKKKKKKTPPKKKKKKKKKS